MATGRELENPMSTKATLAHHFAEDEEAVSWHLYEEVFESGVVYLELEGVAVELRTRELRSRGQCRAGVVLRLPISTAIELGLHSVVPPAIWERVCERDKGGAFGRLKGDDPTEPIERGDE
jgi:hypothetical protein